MGEEEILLVVAVPVVVQEHGYLVVGIVLTRLLRMEDVFVIGDAAALRILLVVVVVESVQLILVSEVGGIDGGIEVAHALVLEISTRIEILQVETKAETLIDIGGKTGIKEVFAVGLVTTCAVAQVGDR